MGRHELPDSFFDALPAGSELDTDKHPLGVIDLGYPYSDGGDVPLNGSYSDEDTGEPGPGHPDNGVEVPVEGTYTEEDLGEEGFFKQDDDEYDDEWYAEQVDDFPDLPVGTQESSPLTPLTNRLSGRQGTHRMPGSSRGVSSHGVSGWVIAALFSAAAVIVIVAAWSVASELLPDRLTSSTEQHSGKGGVSNTSLPNTASPASLSQYPTGVGSVPAPAAGQVTTIVLDQSMPTVEGNKDRLANVAAALSNIIKNLPSTSGAGLRTFDGVTSQIEVPTGSLGDSIDDQSRTTALVSALNRQYSSSGGAVSFTTLKEVYTEALAGFIPGQQNSILIITAGPHTDKSLDGNGLQNFIRQNANQGKPIAVNIIDFGEAPDQLVWEDVARTSGGKYWNLPTSSSPELVTALSTCLN